MTIQFTGVGSGLPISDWIDALVGLKQDDIDALTKQQEALQEKSNTLNTLKATYNSVKTATTKLTDSLFGPSSDIFSKVQVSTSDESIVECTVTQVATPTRLTLEVERLATKSQKKTYENEVFKDSSKKLSELGDVQTGSFTINGAVISVSPDMTVDGLIYAINNSPDAKVKAFMENGQIVLESTEYGNHPIEVVETNSNFVHLAGWDDQTEAYNIEGLTAKYKINGEEREANSNTLDSTNTGVVGLTVNLLSVTETDAPVTIEVSRDFSADDVLSAVEEFVTTYNKAIADTDTATAAGTGQLNGETSLIYIRNRLRTMTSDEVLPNGVYKSLADIGITTGAPGLDVDAETNQLVIDEKKFLEAFTANPTAVKELLIGSNTDSNNVTEGFMQMMQGQLDSALDTQGGYFNARAESLQSQISNMADKISKKEDQLLVYQEQITKQFTYMDQQIAQMQAQFTQLQQQLSSIGVSTGSS